MSPVHTHWRYQSLATKSPTWPEKINRKWTLDTYNTYTATVIVKIWFSQNNIRCRFSKVYNFHKFLYKWYFTSNHTHKKIIIKVVIAWCLSTKPLLKQLITILFWVGPKPRFVLSEESVQLYDTSNFKYIIRLSDTSVTLIIPDVEHIKRLFWIKTLMCLQARSQYLKQFWLTSSDAIWHY